MSDASERTLPATSRRRQLAEREGMLPTAALPAWGAGVAVTVLLLPAWWRATLSAAMSSIHAACAPARLAPQPQDRRLSPPPSPHLLYQCPSINGLTTLSVIC